MELSLLILVCIRKSYIVYLLIYVVPIGHGFSFFGHGKSMLKKRGHRVVCSRIQTVDSETIWVDVCSCRKVKLYCLQAQQLRKPGLAGCTLDFPVKGFLCEVSRARFPSWCHPMETHHVSHFLHPVRLLKGNGSHSVLRWLGNFPRKLLVGKDRVWRPHRWALGEQVHGMW